MHVQFTLIRKASHVNATRLLSNLNKKNIDGSEFHFRNCTSDSMQDAVVDGNVGSLYTPNTNSFIFSPCLILGCNVEVFRLRKPKAFFSPIFNLAFPFSPSRVLSPLIFKD